MNRDEQTIYYDLPESYKSPSTSNLPPSTSYWELKQANMAVQPPQLTHESLSNLNHQDFRASPLDPNYDSAGSLMEPSAGPDVDVYRQQYSISRDGTKIFPSVSTPYRCILYNILSISFNTNHFSTVAGQWGDYNGGDYYTNAEDYYSRLVR